MPYKDPEAKRAAARAYRAANRDRINAVQRAKRAADPESARARDRARIADNPARKREYGQRYYAANREKVLERCRENHLRSAHGLTPGQFAELWQVQKGCCYLCGDDLPRDRRSVHVDHDHACCPPNRSCDRCRRGLACQRCNRAIGYFGDDPDLIARVADGLRAAQERIAGTGAEIVSLAARKRGTG